MHCSSDTTFLIIWRNNIKDYIRWNILDSDIRSSESLIVYKSKVLRFIRPKANCFFNCLNPKGIKLITKLRVGFSHLRDHKFKYSFHDCLNHIAAVVLKSKQLFIICFTVPTTYMKEKPFWATSNLPFLIFWNKMTLLLMFLSLVILL